MVGNWVQGVLLRVRSRIAMLWIPLVVETTPCLLWCESAANRGRNCRALRDWLNSRS